MKIAITGASGLIGTKLQERLRAADHEPVRMVRSNPRGTDILWKTDGPLDPAALRGIGAVVHLAGESIGGGRWTSAKKSRIMDSRVNGTTTIAEAIAKSDGGPTVLISASAIGIYGDRGDEVLTEKSTPGDDFLSSVVTAWEAAAEPAKTAGVRVVHPRFGIVLDPGGGALQPLTLLTKAGLGGKLGDGTQWWSWVAVDDVTKMVLWAIENEDAEGVYNVTGPTPTTQADFIEVLGDVLNRPTFFPTPAFAPKLLLGELADALLFNSQRVEPTRLQAEGYGFAFTDLGPALRAVLD